MNWYLENIYCHVSWNNTYVFVFKIFKEFINRGNWQFNIVSNSVAVPLIMYLSIENYLGKCYYSKLLTFRQDWLRFFLIIKTNDLSLKNRYTCTHTFVSYNISIISRTTNLVKLVYLRASLATEHMHQPHEDINILYYTYVCMCNTHLNTKHTSCIHMYYIYG